MPAGLAERLDRPVRRRSEGGARRRHRRRRRSRRCRRDLRHRLRAVPRRSAPLRRRRAGGAAPTCASASRPEPPVRRAVAGRASLWCTHSVSARRRRSATRGVARTAGRDDRARRSGEEEIVEKIWLKHYPKGVPAEIDVNEYASVRDVFDGERRPSTRRAPRTPAWASRSRSRELDTLSAAFGAWLQANGCKKGTRVALMMPNILQYPVCLFGTLRAGCTVVNVNPLYTARELEHQLERLRRRGDRRRRELRAHGAGGRRQDQGARRSIVTSIGELLGFKGIVVDFVLRHVKKMIPAWTLPGSIRLSDALAAGRGAASSSGCRSATTTSRSCSTRAARRASRRARCCCTGTSSPTCCRRARGCGRSSSRASARSSSRRCRSITSSR